MALSDTSVRSLKAGPKAFRAYDERGLYVEVGISGGRYWRLKYRHNGKEKVLALGVYPDVGLKEARTRREEARKLIANGVDPSEHKKSEKRSRQAASGNTFQTIGREWYGRHEAKWSESHKTRLLSMFDRCIYPYLGSRPITEIAASEVLTVLRRIEKTSVDTAHRALSDCGLVFRYAISTDRALSDPTPTLKGSLLPKNDGHFAATTEPKRLGEILSSFDVYRGSPVVRLALKLAPLMFVRPGELRRAKWSEIDSEKAQWEHFITKTKTWHIVPLSTQVMSSLEELRLVSGKSPYLFPGARSTARPMSENAVLVALRLMEIGPDEMTGHGFRAVARTILDETLKFRPDIIEHQLGHTVRDPLGRAYNRTQHLDERKVMMQAWADHLDVLKASGK